MARRTVRCALPALLAIGLSLVPALARAQEGLPADASIAAELEESRKRLQQIQQERAELRR